MKWLNRPIYLDYNATTPVDPRVLESMLPYLRDEFGKPSSSHGYGVEARSAVDQARSEVAALVGASEPEIVFTSSGSESNNLALKGVVFGRLGERPHVITTVVEHPAVLTTLSYLQQRFGVDMTVLGVDDTGSVSAEDVRNALRPNTVLISVMHANNETGTIQPVSEIGQIARERQVLLHVDAAQSCGKIAVDVGSMNADLVTIVGHKMYAPKGVAALWVREGVSLDPLIHGSSQETVRRAGTESVALVVALGTAAHIARNHLDEEMPRLKALRDRLHEALRSEIAGLSLNGHLHRRLPNTLNVSFPDALGQDVLDAAPGVAASTGAACHSGETEPSDVLLAMDIPRQRALGAVRLSLGRWSNANQIDSAAAQLMQANSKVRAIAHSH